MNPRVAPFADLFKFDTVMVKRALDGVSDANLHKRINDTGSSLHWLVGHFVNSRVYLGNMIDAGTEFKYNDLFGGDGKPLKEPSAYPPISEVLKGLDSVSTNLVKRLGELTDKEIDKKLDGKWPHGGDTNLGAIAFMAYHEGWHLGQMSFLRKQLGYKGLAG